MLRKDFKIEICTNSAESVRAAIEAGADRIELCAGMPEGGTTPSFGEIALVRELLPCGMHVIIRPRGGDFLYSEEECDVMIRDIDMAKKLGVDGVVLGCLTAEGDVDVDKMRRLMAAAGDMSVTFHRAFDMCREPLRALKTIEELGCERILTSGQKGTAEEGISLLKELVACAREVIIMPGCGVRENNIAKLEAETGAKEFHTSARSIVYSKMEYRNENVPMGSSIVSSEFETVETDRNKVAAYL